MGWQGKARQGKDMLGRRKHVHLIIQQSVHALHCTASEGAMMAWALFDEKRCDVGTGLKANVDGLHGVRVAAGDVGRIMAEAAARVHRRRMRLYCESMEATVSFAVQRCARRIIKDSRVSLTELFDMRDANEKMHRGHFDMSADELERLPLEVRRDVIERALAWSWARQIFNVAIDLHPDMHLNVSMC